MKSTFFGAVFCICIVSCKDKTTNSLPHEPGLPIEGTWKLISGTTIQDGDTTFTDYTEGQESIKIIDKTHFAFLRHDLNGGNDSTAVFVAGGGTYSLTDSRYTEHLEYCNYREWEGHDFEFELMVKGDTLVQTGIEKVEDLGVDRVIIETYLMADGR